jgi:hypothetical protein
LFVGIDLEIGRVSVFIVAMILHWMELSIFQNTE